MPDAKRAGHCSNCDAQVFTIVAADPVTGAPTKIGGPLENAWRVTYAMADGSTCDMTFCADCKDRAGEPDVVVRVWRRALDAFAIEIDRPDVPAQTLAAVAALADENRPLGMINARKWLDEVAAPQRPTLLWQASVRRLSNEAVASRR